MDRRKTRTQRLRLSTGMAVVLAAMASVALTACRSSVESVPGVYRFGDHLSEARIEAPRSASAIELAQPVVWDFDEAPEDWTLRQGNLGFIPGRMVLQGDRRAPAVSPPPKSHSVWSGYQAVLIRMMARGGREIKIRIGDWEAPHPLAPAGQDHVYRFDLGERAATAEPLVILPTDSATAMVAVDFIKLLPRRVLYTEPAGLQMVGKQSDYRNVVYAHTPSTLTYQVAVGEGTVLRFAVGMGEKAKPVRFQVLADEAQPLYSAVVEDLDTWHEAEVDLSAYAGRTLALTFQAESDSPEAVGLWANPILLSSGKREKPNVLVYLIDTLRADRMSLYGYGRPTTPFLEQLGREGVVFEDCHVQATWTKPSVASMMTSLYPVTHGITRGEDTIPSGATTLAEQLRAHGWTTASMVANPFAGRSTGLERGFDYLVEFPAIKRRQSEEQRDTDSAALNEIALPWLERHGSEPFFLYLHSTDPHAPYHPPRAFEERFANPAETARFEVDFSKMLRHRLYGGAVFSRQEAVRKGVDPDLFVKRAFHRYDAEIAHNDNSIQILLDKLRKLGVLENTLVMVISDHGEEFLEHGWTGHGHSLYQEQTRAAWLMWNPTLLPAPRRISQPVQLIDLMPTLLDLLGIEPKGIFQGRSLASIARGGARERSGPIMTSRLPPEGSANQGLPQSQTNTFARLDGEWKLIYREQAEQAALNRLELYDRRSDPADEHNIADEHPELSKRLLAELLEWQKAQQEIRQMLGPLGESTPDPETLEQLRNLGYIGGGPAPQD